MEYKRRSVGVECLRVAVNPSGVNNSHRLAHSYQLPHPRVGEISSEQREEPSVVEPRPMPPVAEKRIEGEREGG